MEAKLKAGSSKGTEKSTRCTVDVNGDVKPRFLFKFVEQVRDFLDRFVMTSIGRAKDDKDAWMGQFN
jgi:hypothetical protein